MRDHTRAFCRTVAETFECPTPIYEFGSYQVEGQTDLIDLRGFFTGREYVGCDMRPGPGVDRVEDVTRISLPDESVGTILCIETFEHVFEVHRGFDEVFRVLKPGGLFVITSPFYFHIHGYPDDYWRMTPSCLKRWMSRYEGRICGFQGAASTPHTVMALGFKRPAPVDFESRAARFVATYQGWLAETHARETRLNCRRVCRWLRLLGFSKAERRRIREDRRAEFAIECGPPSDASGDRSVDDAPPTIAPRTVWSATMGQPVSLDSRTIPPHHLSRTGTPNRTHSR